MSTQVPQRDVMADAAGGVMMKLDAIKDLLQDWLLSSEQEPDFDQTYVAGGTAIAADAVQVFQIPRTMKHVELTLEVASTAPANCIVAVFSGNLNLVQAQQQHNKNAAATVAASNAITTNNSGGMTVRDMLDGSGYLTVYFLVTAAVTVYANVRIRQLDETQARGQRT